MEMRQKIYKCICLFLPLGKRIVFESNPEFSCNTMPVFEEMMRRGISKQYKIYWLVEDKTKYQNDKSGIRFLNYCEKRFDQLKLMYILATSKALIFSNRFLVKYKQKQLVINLMHGSPLKLTKGYEENDTCDYVISQSSFFNEKVAWGLNVPLSKIRSFGFPRTDVLDKATGSRKKIGISLRSKLIVWMPTFRKNKNTGLETGDLRIFGIPLFSSYQDFDRINTILNLMKCILVIKLHPVEDISHMFLENWSNIKFISDEELKEKGTSTYELLAESDALITDYSSVYYDYLLTDKPIGLVIDDLKEYTERNGFYYGEYKDFVKGYYIETIEELLSFIKEISEGKDSKKEERERAKNRYCQYTDFKSTERVTDFIMGKLK